MLPHHAVIRAVVCLSGLLLLGPSTASQPVPPRSEALTWTNPILPQRADPHVTLHDDGYYYMVATAPEYDRIELRRARTLGELSEAEPRVIFRKFSSGPMSHHIWAPEIHFIDGAWYVYFSASRADSIWALRMYAMANDSADPFEGEWEIKGQIRTEWETFSLDHTTFEHRGRRYFVWTQAAPGERGTNIYISEMDAPWSVVGPQVMLTKPDLEWERRGHRVNEAPAVLKRNGRIFMTYSASATDHNYCLGLLVADENANLLLANEWVKSPEPVLRSSDEAGQYGTGHNCFTTTPDGETDILVYHARSYRDIQGEPLWNPDRATRAQVILWDEDGMPIFGPPVPDGAYDGEAHLAGGAGQAR